MTPQQLNAERLADYLEEGRSAFNGTAAEMLRRQHEAIKKLREALALTSVAINIQSNRLCAIEAARQALKDTEGLL